MHFPNIQKDEAFLGSRLWLPKARINVFGIKTDLTIDFTNPRYGATDEPLTPMYYETPTHLIVPRHYLDPTTRKYPTRILRPKFKHVSFGANIRPRDNIQSKAINSLDTAGLGGTLNLACGLGKTVVSLASAFKLGVPFIVIVHTTQLLEQWKESILQFSNLTEQDIGIVQGNKADWDKPIVIAMLHTLAQRADSWDPADLLSRGLAIYDEVHHLSAPTFNTAASLFVGKRWGLSATPTRPDKLERIFKYHIGDIVMSYMTQALTPDIIFLRTNIIPTHNEYRSLFDRSGSLNVSKLKSWLGGNAQRTNIILQVINKLKNEGRQIVVLSHILSILNDLDSVINNAGLCIGKVPQVARQDIIKSGANPLLLSAQIGKEGLDKPTLDALIFATPFSDTNMLIQGMGRVLRDVPGKRTPLVIYIEDSRIDNCRNMAWSLKQWLLMNNYKYKIIDTQKGGI